MISMLQRNVFVRACVLSCALLSLPTWAASVQQAPAPLAPPLAISDTRIALQWKKPANYADIVDYQVLVNGKPAGTASDNARLHSPAQAYIDKFYAADARNFHVRISHHAYIAADLKPGTEYRFAIRAMYRDGSLSAPGPTLRVKTTASPGICDISSKGAVGDGKTLNTASIQRTIQECPAGHTVRIPAGVFKSGALFLKNDMTLELAAGATLLGSERAEDYPLLRGYTLYEYSTVNRPPSLLNALDPIRRNAGAFRNIRIVGKGVIDGNGWIRASTPSIIDEAGQTLPVYAFGTNSSVKDLGILAKDQVAKSVEQGMALGVAYSQRRSSLMTLRGVQGLYLQGVTLRNPAFHGAMILESEHVTVDGIRIETFDVNNADGLEFGNSEHISVFNSFFDTGDDCVNFAAGTGEKATSQPAQSDAWIFNNYFRKGHGAVVLGSHTGAWIENILAEDNVSNLTWIGLRAKSNNINGGGGRHVLYRDNAHRDLERESFIFTLEYSDPNQLIDYPAAATPAKFHDIVVRNNTVEFTPAWKPTPVPQGPQRTMTVVDFRSIEIQGDPRSNAFHEDILFDNVKIDGAHPAKIDALRNSRFRKVIMSNTRGNDAPWKVSNAPGVVFEDTPGAP